jgi:hypothetical protein
MADGVAAGALLAFLRNRTGAFASIALVGRFASCGPPLRGPGERGDASRDGRIRVEPTRRQISTPGQSFFEIRAGDVKIRRGAPSWTA